jgi:threonine/homoserine/homoserine lactone efflux protein
MDSLAAVFFTSLGVGLTGAVMPGPLLVFTLKESLNGGKWAALWLSAGHSFCELLMVAILVAGLSRFISVDPIVGPVGIIGGAVLLWMGYSAFKPLPTDVTPIDHPSRGNRAHTLVLGGVTVTVANPYWLLWWLTAGLALVLVAAKMGLAGITAFYFGHISADFLWFGFLGLVVGSRRQMLGANLYRHMIRVCGVFLLLFGLLFVGYGSRLVHSTFIQ